MKIEELVGDTLWSSIKQLRENSDSYEEIVIFNKDISEWNKILIQKLGPPLVPDGINENVWSSDEISPMEKDAALDKANSCGGIRGNQTLYYGTYESQKLLIMIWPWQDNVHTTLKKVVV
jgi:hypothetical protein